MSNFKFTSLPHAGSAEFAKLTAALLDHQEKELKKLVDRWLGRESAHSFEYVVDPTLPRDVFEVRLNYFALGFEGHIIVTG